MLTTQSPSGLPAEMLSKSSLSKQINTIQQFTAEISCTDATFLDTIIHKGQRFNTESDLDMMTHFKPTEAFQYTFFTTCHPPGANKGIGKGEALRLQKQTLQTKRLKRTLSHLKNTLWRPQNFINNTLSEVKFQGWTQALLQRNKTKKRILPFVIKLQSRLSKGSQRISSV